jgi:hypothetical protein
MIQTIAGIHLRRWFFYSGILKKMPVKKQMGENKEAPAYPVLLFFPFSKNSLIQL